MSVFDNLAFKDDFSGVVTGVWKTDEHEMNDLYLCTAENVRYLVTF